MLQLLLKSFFLLFLLISLQGCVPMLGMMGMNNNSMMGKCGGMMNMSQKSGMKCSGSKTDKESKHSDMKCSGDKS